MPIGNATSNNQMPEQADKDCSSSTLHEAAGDAAPADNVKDEVEEEVCQNMYYDAVEHHVSTKETSEPTAQGWIPNNDNETMSDAHTANSEAGKADLSRLELATRTLSQSGTPLQDEPPVPQSPLAAQDPTVCVNSNELGC